MNWHKKKKTLFLGGGGRGEGGIRISSPPRRGTRIWWIKYVLKAYSQAGCGPLLGLVLSTLQESTQGLPSPEVSSSANTALIKTNRAANCGAREGGAKGTECVCGCVGKGGSRDGRWERVLRNVHLLYYGSLYGRFSVTVLCQMCQYYR